MQFFDYYCHLYDQNVLKQKKKYYKPEEAAVAWLNLSGGSVESVIYEDVTVEPDQDKPCSIASKTPPPIQRALSEIVKQF